MTEHAKHEPTLPLIGPCAVCGWEIEYGESYRMGRDGKRRHAACEDGQARHEPTPHDPIRLLLADDDARNALLEQAVYVHPAPTVAEVAARLGWSPLAVAEAVGAHYWMFLSGDLRSPETAKVDHDGE